MSINIDALLKLAAHDLSVAIEEASNDSSINGRSQAGVGRRRRWPLIVAAAGLIAVAAATVIVAVGQEPNTIQTVTPTPDTSPSTQVSDGPSVSVAASTSTAAPADQSDDSPSSGDVDTLAAPLAFEVDPNALPAGFELFSVSDLAARAPVVPVLFHGIVVAVDAKGIPTGPVIHVETPDDPEGPPGVSTPVEVGAFSGEYTIWESEFVNLASPQADVRWMIGDQQIMVSGPDDADQLLSVARSIALTDSGAVNLDPPDGFVWWPGTTNFDRSGSTVTYLGPELAQLMISTRPTPEGGLYAEALRVYSPVDGFGEIDGRPSQEYSSGWGVSSISFESGDGQIVTINQDAPGGYTDDNEFRWPIDQSKMRNLVASLAPVTPEQWAAMAANTAPPADPDDLITDHPLSAPRLVRSVAGPVEVAIVTEDGSNSHGPLRIVHFPDGQGLQLRFETGEGASSRGLRTRRGVSGPNSSVYLDDGTQTTTGLLSAGDDVNTIALTNGEISQTIPLTEAFPTLVPGQRYAYIAAVGSQYWLDITLIDGTKTLQYLGY